MNLLDNARNQQFKFKTENWVTINDESRGTYNEVHQIRLNTLLSRWSDYTM